MDKYIKHIKEETIEEKEVPIYEGYSLGFLDNEYENGNYSDDDRVYLIVKLLHSIKDTTYGGFITEDDYRLITHYFTDKYHAKQKEKKEKYE